MGYEEARYSCLLEMLNDSSNPEAMATMGKLGAALGYQSGNTGNAGMYAGLQTPGSGVAQVAMPDDLRQAAVNAGNTPTNAVDRGQVQQELRKSGEVVGKNSNLGKIPLEGVEYVGGTIKAMNAEAEKKAKAAKPQGGD